MLVAVDEFSSPGCRMRLLVDDRWREMGSNHRLRVNGELKPVGAAYHSMSSEE
jgi:hypothetical protein